MYIVAYDSDTNSWYITEDDIHPYRFDRQYNTYLEAYKWFINNKKYVLQITNSIREDLGQPSIIRLILEDCIII